MLVARFGEGVFPLGPCTVLIFLSPPLPNCVQSAAWCRDYKEHSFG